MWGRLSFFGCPFSTPLTLSLKTLYVTLGACLSSSLSVSGYSPESLRNRNDVFYLQPERSCIAESPLWYSVIPMDKSMLESMLNRILAVREIYEEHSRGVGGLDDDMD